MIVEIPREKMRRWNMIDFIIQFLYSLPSIIYNFISIFAMSIVVIGLLISFYIIVRD